MTIIIKRFLIVLIFTVGLCLYYNSLLFSDEYSTTFDSNRIHIFPSEVIKEKKVAIVFQKSPVQPEYQLIRLQEIDRSWKKWCSLKDFKYLSNIQLYGVLPFQDEQKYNIQVTESSFHYIDISYGSSKNCPFYNFIKSLLLSIQSNSHIEWIVIGNDHTFFIPSNLVCFLESLDPDLLVYTGNKLLIKYRNIHLYFASGGAGAIFSHVTVKVLLLSYAIIKSDLLYAALNDLLPQNWFKLPSYYENCKLFQDSSNMIDIDTTQNKKMFLCLLQYIWIHNQSYTENVTLNIKLSSRVSLTVNLPTINSTSTKSTINNQQPKNEATITILKDTQDIRSVSFTQLQQCEAYDKWSLDNPGILIAFCLQSIYNISFTSSLPHDMETGGGGGDSLLERFNVYGPVRMLTYDTDKWYMEAKNILSINDTTKSMATARDTISFHYVSQIEAALLTSLLTLPFTTPTSSTINTTTTTTPLTIPSIQQLFTLWPKDNKDVGHYSKRINNDEVASRLHKFLFQDLIIFNQYCMNSKIT